MILIDKKIIERGENLITPFCRENVQNICYDLTPEMFCISSDTESTEFDLAPGNCVFVQSKESITLPPNLIATIILRNSRIRQGLNLTAPIYQPGHHTKLFFRITNVSQQSIKLDCTKGIASIMFTELDENVDSPYNGAYQQEFDFKGLGSYKSTLAKDITSIADKVDSVKNIEKDMYGNVLAIMAIFVGIFSLINLNVSLVTQNINMLTLLTLNFATIGSIGFLIAIINTILPGGKHRIAVWIACILAFLAAIGLQIMQYFFTGLVP